MVIDHLDTSWTEDGRLKISNPTAWPAKVTVLVQTSAQALRDPLPQPCKLPVVEVPARG